MFRTRLTGAALLAIAFLPGCGILCGDRPRICERFRGNRVEAAPTSFPGGEGGCGGSVIPPGGMMGGPMMIGPGGYEMFPTPGGYGAPNIPKAGIIDTPGENKGKQFDPDKSSRTGPVLMIPANGMK